jgi:hypothetical protein
MIVYRLIAGAVRDLRFVVDDYQPIEGEVVIHGADTLPDPATLAPPPTPAQMQAVFTIAIQARLDDFARTRNYDGILSACTYATSAVPAFAAEGHRCVQARDATWTAAYTVLADVLAGRRAMPTLSQVMAEMPVLSWT